MVSRATVAAAVVVLSASSALASEWLDPAWGYRVRLVADPQKVAGDLTDTPVLLLLDRIGASHTFWDNVKTDGGDLAVTSSDGTTRLPLEVVSIDVAGHAGEIWFKGALSSTADTGFYLYYGNASATQPAATDTYGSNNVWDAGYRHVCHLQTDAANTSGYNAGLITTGGVPDDVAGQVGGAQGFDSAHTEHYAFQNPDCAAFTAFTTEVWAKCDNAADGNSKHVWSEHDRVRIEVDGSGNLQYRIYRAAGAGSGGDTGYDYDSDAWHHLVLLAENKGTYGIYVDGASVDSATDDRDLGWKGGQDRVSLARNNSSGGDSWLGGLDEYRFSDVLRSTDYIKTQYDMQKDQSTFWKSVGMQETPGSGVAVDPVSGLETDESGAKTSFTVALTREPTADVTVSLSSSDTGEGTIDGAAANVLTLTFNPDGGAKPWSEPQTVTVTGTDDDLIDGDVGFLIQFAVSSGDAGYDGMSVEDVTVTNKDDEAKALSLVIAPASVTEGDGTLVGQGEVSVAGRVVGDLEVDLASDPTGEISVPASVTIPDGASSATFDLAVEDDDRIDGTVTVTVTASLSGWTEGSDTVDTHDNEVKELSVSLPASATEGEGLLARAGTASIPGPYYEDLAPADLVVSLASDAPAELAVPASATIPAGSTEAAFDLMVPDDDPPVIDGTQTVAVTASLLGWTSGSGSIDVLDDDMRFTVSLPASAREGDGVLSAAGTVSLPAASPSDIAVALESSDTSEITVPQSVTISSGSASQAFGITVVDDVFGDGPRTAAVTAKLLGWTSGSAEMEVLDDEPVVEVAATDPSAREPDDPGAFTVTRDAISGEPLTVYFTVTGTAAEGIDFAALSAALPPEVTIPAGTAAGAMEVVPLDDRTLDGGETVIVTLQWDADASLYYVPPPGSSATVVISDDERGGIGGGTGGCSAGGGSSACALAALGAFFACALPGAWRRARGCA
jgi:hypothetical protein